MSKGLKGLANFFNDVPSGSKAVVKTGDSVVVSLVSGAGKGDIVSTYINNGSRNVAQFTVTTQMMTLAVNSTISNIGYVNDIKLSADNGTLFIATTDSCSETPSCLTPANNGGLYTYNVTSPASPQQIGYAGYATSGYKWVGYNSIELSSNGQSAYIASGEQEFQILNISSLSAPTLTSSLSTTCQATGVAMAINGSLFVTTACNLLQISVTNPALPSILNSVNNASQQNGLSVSPDGTQIGMARGIAEVVDTSSGSLGTDTNISSVISDPLALTYVANKTALIVNQGNIAIVDLTT